MGKKRTQSITNNNQMFPVESQEYSWNPEVGATGHNIFFFLDFLFPFLFFPHESCFILHLLMLDLTNQFYALSISPSLILPHYSHSSSTYSKCIMKP